VLKRLFREGSEVTAGQVLFQIDPAPYQASFDSAKAALAKARANVVRRPLQAGRYKPLVEENAVSQRDYVNVVSAQKQAESRCRFRAGGGGNGAHQSGLRHGKGADCRQYWTRIGDRGRTGQPDRGNPARADPTDHTVYVNFTQSPPTCCACARMPPRKAMATRPGTCAVLQDGGELAKPGKLLFPI
jgi:membrane fusion protein (multidrug efflux system)